MVSASSASRSPEAATPATAGTPPTRQPAVDVTAITSQDDFLLELGQTLGGQAAVRPVDTLEAALEAMASGKRGQLLVIDARELPDVRAMVDAAHAALPRAVLLVFAAATKERQLAAKLKGSKVFAVLPTPVDSPKTQAVLDGAIEAAAHRRQGRTGLLNGKSTSIILICSIALHTPTPGVARKRSNPEQFRKCSIAVELIHI